MHQSDPSRSTNDAWMACSLRTHNGEHDLASHFEQAALANIVKPPIPSSSIGPCALFICKMTVTHSF